MDLPSKSQQYREGFGLPAGVVRHTEPVDPMSLSGILYALYLQVTLFSLMEEYLHLLPCSHVMDLSCVRGGKGHSVVQAKVPN